MKKKNGLKNIKKEVKGITLVALVVTIIVLIILAGVAISLTIGNNGIFERAGNSADKYKEASKNEEDEMKNAVNFIDNYLLGKENDDESSDKDDEEEGSIPITESEWELSGLNDEEKNIDGYYLIENDCTIKDETGITELTSTGDKVLKVADGITCTIEGGAFLGNIELGTNSTLIIYSGTFGENIKIAKSSKLKLLGGTINKNIELEDNSILEAQGGTILGKLVAKNNVTMTVAGGTYGGGFEIGSNSSLEITGGLFAVNPSQYVPSEYRVEPSGDWYMVSPNN